MCFNSQITSNNQLKRNIDYWVWNGERQYVARQTVGWRKMLEVS